MWWPFKRKNSRSDSGNSADQNSVDDIANSLLSEGRVAELELELERLDVSSLSDDERESWWHLYGIAAFQRGEDDIALSRFQEAYSLFPSAVKIRFSLGQQYIRAGKPDEAFALFRQCVFPEISREYALFQARYAYLWGRYDDGVSFIDSFYPHYKDLRILDDHFLYVRGLPFFGTWWSYLAAFSVLSGSFEKLEQVTSYVTEHCHDYDFERLNQELIAHRDNDVRKLLNLAEQRCTDIVGSGIQSGYAATRVAVLRAQLAPSLDRAMQHLDSVALEPTDFQWLADILILAKAEAAKKSNHLDRENELVNSFMIKQSLLFEPDIALDFNLLGYQETLKLRVLSK